MKKTMFIAVIAIVGLIAANSANAQSKKAPIKSKARIWVDDSIQKIASQIGVTIKVDTAYDGVGTIKYVEAIITFSEKNDYWNYTKKGIPSISSTIIVAYVSDINMITYKNEIVIKQKDMPGGMKNAAYIIGPEEVFETAAGNTTDFRKYSPFGSNVRTSLN